MVHSILKSPSTSSTPSKRRVSFNKRVEAVHIRHHRDYSKQELQSCWHSCEDYQAIKQEVQHTIEYYNRSQSDIITTSSTQNLEVSNFCFRGLEHRTHSKVLKGHLRSAAWCAVLDEQDLQNDLGMPNDVAVLSEVYSVYSLPALRIAQQRAWKDASEAGYVMEAKPPMAVIAKTSDTASSCLPATAMRGLPAHKNSIVSHAA